jgi:hypothetical protein
MKCSTILIQEGKNSIHGLGILQEKGGPTDAELSASLEIIPMGACPIK